MISDANVSQCTVTLVASCLPFKSAAVTNVAKLAADIVRKKHTRTNLPFCPVGGVNFLSNKQQLSTFNQLVGAVSVV